MIEMHSKYVNVHINGMFMPYFALIIMFYHVKIACYQLYPKSFIRLVQTNDFEYMVTDDDKVPYKSSYALHIS